jgi:D-alanine-D-alanine ligase
MFGGVSFNNKSTRFTTKPERCLVICLRLKLIIVWSKMEIVLIKSYTEKPWRSLETYELIEASLREKWAVEAINTKNPENLYRFISKLKHYHGPHLFVFNIAEYLDEKNKAVFLPALLEELKVPHLGSSAEAVEIGLDKVRTKECIIEHQIPTPQYFVAAKGDSNIGQRAQKIGYPLIVKPIGEGGHIGISADSIVYDEVSLEKNVNRIFEVHHQPALVETYISGKGMREFSVGIIDGQIKLFTPIEIDFEAMHLDKDILSFESAQKDLEKTKLMPDEKMRSVIIDLSRKTFDAVGAQDYSRVDLRMNHMGCYVIEINVMPGLGPHSFLPAAAKDIHGLEYGQFIQKLVENSIQRQANGSRFIN